MKKHVIFDCDGTLLDTSGNSFKLFSGIKELLEELSRDCALYVWTARGRDSTRRILGELGILHFFDSLCTLDDAYPKPHISGIQSLVGTFANKTVCMIGDTSNDILGAKNYGVMAIGAIWNKESNGDILKEFGADFIVSHPSECSKLIQLNLNGE